MKKIIVLGMTTTLLLSSCSSFMGGTYIGGSLGSVLGSAVGGIAGGARGSDIGTIIGMVGGAAAGAAIDAQANKKTKGILHERYEQLQENRDIEQQDYLSETRDESGFDSTNSGDDRLYGFQMEPSEYPADTSVRPLQFSNEANIERLTLITKETPQIEVSNLVFTDNNGNNILSRGEEGQIAFEIHDKGTQAIGNLYPTITETANSNHFKISPSSRIDVMMPGEVVRYTATIKADKRIKSGEYNFSIAILKDNRSISKVMELRLSTQK
ncbi:hypothetical protein [Prevotella aurantiaca]|uniref:hypothetical protein n=1 Tax=Prevotella aurantiaca TaxID=596085 RepID=UPI002356EE79|nr:hypothetical protein [Prevotella aurantiaca]